MQVLLSMLVVLGSMVDVIETKDDVGGMREECAEFHNGCSVPKLNPSNSIKKYGTFFEPACLRHDLCYSCVS